MKLDNGSVLEINDVFLHINSEKNILNQNNTCL